MVDKETYAELKESLENTKMAIRSGRPRYALSHVVPLLDALFNEVFELDAAPAPVEEESVEEEETLTVSGLVDAYDRDALNEMAEDADVEDPDKLSTKSDVAEAIISAQ